MSDNQPAGSAAEPGAAAVHPAATYLINYDGARGQVQAEIARQEFIAKHDPSPPARTQAQIDGAALVSELGKMQAEHVAFFVKIVTMGAASGPAQAVVDETVRLNKDLAATVIDNNRAGIFIGLIQEWLSGAIAVFSGAAPPAQGGASGGG